LNTKYIKHKKVCGIKKIEAKVGFSTEQKYPTHLGKIQRFRKIRNTRWNIAKNPRRVNLNVIKPVPSAKHLNADAVKNIKTDETKLRKYVEHNEPSKGSDTRRKNPTPTVNPSKNNDQIASEYGVILKYEEEVAIAVITSLSRCSTKK
jgi:hypothetical protein